MKTLVLGSNSPRRKEILEQLGYSFTIRASDIDEIIPSKTSVYKAAEYLSIEKNKAIIRHSEEIVITADTVVILDDQILGKPKDAIEAKTMLKKLSNREHTVLTGVCISSINKITSFSCRTNVTFTALADHEIEHYIASCQPLDKAGAYGIQEWIGIAAIKEIKGSYLNVVGLPAERVYHELMSNFELSPF